MMASSNNTLFFLISLFSGIVILCDARLRLRLHVSVMMVRLMVRLSTEPDQINWPNIIIYRRSKKQVIISFVSHSFVPVPLLMSFHFFLVCVCRMKSSNM